MVLQLTRGWKIRIVGEVISVIGLVLLGVSFFAENWGNEYNILFAAAVVIGTIIHVYGNSVRQSEKKILEPKEQEKY